MSFRYFFYIKKLKYKSKNLYRYLIRVQIKFFNWRVKFKWQTTLTERKTNQKNNG
jgi:hypothetical protein